MSCAQSILPAGFRFHPTDEELILHYLMKKAAALPLPVSIITEVDIYKHDPWELPAKAAFGEKEWYFFSQRDRKYPNGARPNRAAASGYWKATGTDKVIASSAASENIGVKKALVFYKGKPPKGIKTAWIMHEYRLAETPSYGSFKHKPLKFRESSSMRLDDWVLCRVYKKSNLSLPHVPSPLAMENDTEQSENHTQGPTVSTYNNNNNILQPQKSSSFSNLLDAMDYTLLNSFLFDSGPVDTTISYSTVNYSPEYYPNHPPLSNYTSVDANDTFMQQRSLQMNTSVPFMENRLKRRLSNHDISASQEAKRCIGSWTSGSGTSQYGEYSQYKLFDEASLGQHVLLSPQIQFEG